MTEQLVTGDSIQILPYANPISIENRVDFQKAALSPIQQSRVNALAQQLPTLSSAQSLSNAYILKIPDGMENAHLLKITQGGYASTMVSNETGKFAGTASLYPVEAQVAMLGAFSAMSVVSGQYFLSQINHELGKINQGIDKILEFLYGDKKAELISEVSFTRFAYQNYASIMDHEQQRIATLISLQESRKVAMKDVEFYLTDLNSCINSKDNSDIQAVVEKAFQVKECLELSTQLYVMSNLLEIYISQNSDPKYLEFCKDEMTMYIRKSEKRMLNNFSTLLANIRNAKVSPLKKFDKVPLEKQVEEAVDILGKAEESELQRTLTDAVNASANRTEFCICTDGRAYFRTKNDV